MLIVGRVAGRGLRLCPEYFGSTSPTEITWQIRRFSLLIQGALITKSADKIVSRFEKAWKSWNIISYWVRSWLLPSVNGREKLMFFFVSFLAFSFRHRPLWNVFCRFLAAFTNPRSTILYKSLAYPLLGFIYGVNTYEIIHIKNNLFFLPEFSLLESPTVRTLGPNETMECIRCAWDVPGFWGLVTNHS